MWKDKPKGVKVASSDPHHYENLKKEVEANRTTSEWKELMARGWKPAIESSRPKVKASEIKRLKPDTVCVVVSMPPFPHTVKISVEAFHRCSSCCSITVVKELSHWPDAKPRKAKK